MMSEFSTHEVTNQPPPLPEYDAFSTDLSLRESIGFYGAGWAEAHLHSYGCMVGGELAALGFDANRHRPQLRTHDRFGSRVDEVDFHPAYHALMAAAVRHGVHAYSWQHPRLGSQVVRAALSYLHHQAEAGTSCPLTMTHAAAPVLEQAGDSVAAWLQKAIADRYDGRNRPASEKRGITLGMGMTEKQGGSDVRTNATVAHPQGGDEYTLVGHKWFFSAPMSDAFLVLAQAPDGLSCFLLPRWRPDGKRNDFSLMRLKDKLGNWANASSEVEFRGAFAQRLGAEGRGIATILQMVALTRLDCMLGSAAQMRRALVEAVHHARHRRAFGKCLIEQPLMRNVLADLAVESEAATAFSLRVAAAVDAASGDAEQAAFARIATAIGKYWICKRAPGFVNEAQECLGGAGYIEESILPRLYREAPLNSIWEGCGNVQCLDVLRALSRESATLEALRRELMQSLGSHVAFDREVTAIDQLLTLSMTEWDARRIVERVAVALQAAVLIKRAPAIVSEAFVASRLLDRRCQGYGTLTTSRSAAEIVERAWPV